MAPVSLASPQVAAADHATMASTPKQLYAQLRPAAARDRITGSPQHRRGQESDAQCAQNAADAMHRKNIKAVVDLPALLHHRHGEEAYDRAKGAEGPEHGREHQR